MTSEHLGRKSLETAALGFAETRVEILHCLRTLGASLCAYGGGEWEDRRCDCKYGGSRQGEATGCPEVRTAYALMLSMSQKEYGLLVERAGGRIAEEIFAEPPGLNIDDASVIAKFFSVPIEKVQAIAKLDQLRRRNV